MFGGQLLAIDGIRIKASNAADQNWSQTKLEQQQARTQAKLEEYLQALEQADARPEPARASFRRPTRTAAA